VSEGERALRELGLREEDLAARRASGIDEPGFADWLNRPGRAASALPGFDAVTVANDGGGQLLTARNAG
jgi:hypothetical protein